MTKFYTNVLRVGNNILYRGYDNGEQIKKRVPFRPKLYKTGGGPSEWKTLEGVPVMEKEYDSMSEAYPHVPHGDNHSMFGRCDVDLNSCIPTLVTKHNACGNVFVVRSEITPETNVKTLWRITCLNKSAQRRHVQEDASATPLTRDAARELPPQPRQDGAHAAPPLREAAPRHRDEADRRVSAFSAAPREWREWECVWRSARRRGEHRCTAVRGEGEVSARVCAARGVPVLWRHVDVLMLLFFTGFWIVVGRICF